MPMTMQGKQAMEEKLSVQAAKFVKLVGAAGVERAGDGFSMMVYQYY